MISEIQIFESKESNWRQLPRWSSGSCRSYAVTQRLYSGHLGRALLAKDGKSNNRRFAQKAQYPSIG